MGEKEASVFIQLFHIYLGLLLNFDLIFVSKYGDGDFRKINMTCKPRLMKKNLRLFYYCFFLSRLARKEGKIKINKYYAKGKTEK